MLIEVPLRQSSINELGRRYYEDPARFHTRIRVAIAPDWHLSCDPQKAKPVSPPENIMAFLLSLDLSTWKYSNSYVKSHSKFQIISNHHWNQVALVLIRSTCCRLGPFTGTTWRKIRWRNGNALLWPLLVLSYMRTRATLAVFRLLQGETKWNQMSIQLSNSLRFHGSLCTQKRVAKAT